MQTRIQHTRTTQAPSVYLKSPLHGRVIVTTLTDEVKEILEKDGRFWYEALCAPVSLSQAAFDKIDQLISPDPHVEPG